MAYSANEIAKAIINRSDTEKGDIISNLKLQKLLYYAQGLYMAMEGEPLFDEKFEKWEYGPVVPELYKDYKVYNSNAIPHQKDFDESNVLNKETSEFLDEIYEILGKYNAITLMNMTHEEEPVKSKNNNDEILIDELKDFFKDWIEEE